MAGIGFELRRIFRQEGLFSLLRGYGYAGVIGSGPWVLSVVGMIAASFSSVLFGSSSQEAQRFLATVTHLIAASLIFTGPLQLLFTRFVADRLFEKEDRVVLSNVLGAMTFVTLLGGGLGASVLWLFAREGFVYCALLLASFVVLCNMWLVVLFVTSLKRYRLVLQSFLLGYASMLVVSVLLSSYGCRGLLAGFFCGHAILVFFPLSMIARAYPPAADAPALVRFDFLNRRKVFFSLAAMGFLYNLGLWIDKIVFWVEPSSAGIGLGPLRASPVYDLPVFLSYFALIPGLAVFLVRIETDFAESHGAFYEAIRNGATLQDIWGLKDRIVLDVRRAVYEIFRVQGVVVCALVLVGPAVLEALGLSTMHGYLLSVQLVGVSALVVLMALLNVLFYLDMRRTALSICACLFLCNLALSLVSLRLGPQFYGYGFAVAAVLSVVLALAALRQAFPRLEYDTFALQRQ